MRAGGRQRSHSKAHPLVVLLGDLGEDKMRRNWANREKALLKLQELMEQAQPEDYSEDLIKELRLPLLAQITDKRSVIVREVCKLIVICSTVLKDKFAVVAKDLVLKMIKIVASGNKVIAAYANACCCDVFRNTQIKHVINHVIDLLEVNKSKDIRESCVTYLTISIANWDKAIVDRSADRIQQALTGALQDASENVRKKARECYWSFQKVWPMRAIEVLKRVDKRTQQTLYSMLKDKKQRASSNDPISEEEEAKDDIDVKQEHESSPVEAGDSSADPPIPPPPLGGQNSVFADSVSSEGETRVGAKAVRMPECSFRSMLRAHRHHLDAALKQLSAEIRLYQEYEEYEDQPEGRPADALCKSYVEQLERSLKSRYEGLAALHEHLYEPSDEEQDDVQQTACEREHDGIVTGESKDEGEVL